MHSKQSGEVLSDIFMAEITTVRGNSVGIIGTFNVESELHLKTHSVPRCKHSVLVIKTSQLMLYRVIIVVCSQIHAKHINTECRQNVELLNVKLVVHIVTTGL